MCAGPELAILSALATAGGTYMQYKSQSDAQDEQRKAAQAEAMRQSNMDKEKFRNFQDALADAGRDTQQERIDLSAEDIEASTAANVGDMDEAAYSTAAASNTPKVVKEYAGQREQEADDFVSALGNALARKGAWGENQFAFGQNMLDRQFNQNQLQTDMNRSAQIGQMEAQYAGQPGVMGAIGNAVTGLGTAGLGYSAQLGAFDGLFSKAPVVTATPTVTNSAAQAAGRVKATGLGNDWWRQAQGTNI